MRKRKQRIKYIVTDYISANVAWLIYDILRYYVIGVYIGYYSLSSFLSQTTIWVGQILFPLFWLVIFYYSGYYNEPFKKSRASEFFTTFISICIGSLIIFFTFILDDLPPMHVIYYQMIASLIGTQLIITYIPRYIITRKTASEVHHRKWGFNTIIIGTGQRAKKLTDELNKMHWSMGNIIIGYCGTKGSNASISDSSILGDTQEIDQIIERYQIEEIIIAEDYTNYQWLYETLRTLFKFNIPIKIAADKYDILTGNAKMSTIYATPMIEITKISMPEWEKNIKQTTDFFISAIALILLTPLFIYIAFKIKNNSHGSIIYKQERIGQYGKPFFIYKFRSMYEHAEQDCPLLSSEKDPRITPFGRFMRKYRLDELPQFWNVLIGDMSIVGPRPERKYFIDQIIKKAPFYYTIQSVKPGITSWGMVKYGYADNIDKMVERLYYDIIYIESMSLLVDLKIIIYTVRTIITGKGI